MRISLILIAPVLLALCPSGRADSVTFLALPEAVSGPAGTTVGWGYSITNNSTTDYLDITSIDSDLFLAADGTPDASIFNFPNVAPTPGPGVPQAVVQAYDPADNLGLFQFTWNSGLPAGTTESGVFTLYGAFCAPSDPFCAEDGSVTPYVLAITPYSATVAGSSSNSVPEPPVLSLMAILMAMAGVYGRGRVQA